MAEEGATLPELQGFDQHLESLSVKYSRHGAQIDSRSFCSDFCKLVEGFCGVQGGAAPQLRVLEVALCYFFRASSFLPPHCDHVQHTLSSLALSVFELLLFLDQKEFVQDALQHLTFTFQESHLVLARHPNVYLLQLKTLIQDGGPWGNRVLQAVLREAEVPQGQVERFLSSEMPLFLELRVRYLLASGRGREAATLARRCADARPSSRQRAFFLQVRLAWLCRAERTEQLHREVCALGGAEVMQVMCGMEQREEDGVLLRLCRAALRNLLHTGHTRCLRQLVCVWGALHRRQQTSRPALLEESRQLLQSATNGTAIFPFIRVLLEELGEAALQFCVELCSRALGSGLVSGGAARALVHKTVAGLLPRDLEVCRACALLVFFQDRTLEAYRTAVRLYSLPDQEYHAEAAPVGNHVRFDLLQVLKKDLVFDPEFWNVAAIRSNCQKLLNVEAQRAAREEAPEEEAQEEAHCTKEAAAVCPLGPPPATAPHRQEAKKRHENGTAPKRTRLCRGDTQSLDNSSLKTKNKHGPRTPPPRESGEFLRRSFWQPSRTGDGFPSSTGHGEQRRITRFSEKNRPKRRIRTPRWLLEDSGTLEMNAHRKGKKLRRKRQQEEAQEKEQEKARALVKRNTSALPKTSTKEKDLVKCELAEKQSGTRHLKGLSLDYLRPASPAQVLLELSLPDNELADIFPDESRRNGLPPVLLYKASARAPGPPPSDRPLRLKHVVIRASDEVSLAQQLHCYARRNKHLAGASEVQNAHSVVTRSSSQAPPTKGRPRLPRSKPLVEMKVTIASHAPLRTRAGLSQRSPTQLDRGHAKVTSAGSLPSDNKTGLVAHRSLAPGYMAIKTARKPTTDAVANTQLAAGGRSLKLSLENVGHEGGKEFSHSAMTEATAQDSKANVHIAGNGDAGRHRVDDVTELVGHDVVTGRASDTHGRHAEEDLHGLRLLSETVSALAPAVPQSIPEAMDEQSLPAQLSPTLGNVPDSPCSPPGTGKSPCSLGEPESEEEPVQEPEGVNDRSAAWPEPGEPRLEYRCTLCDKVFRGKRVVVHAMFHYRRDQCMFCGVLLKDGLLAMMHLSEHIDTLKKLRETEHEGPAGGAPERSVELQTTSPPPLACGQRRPRKSITTPASAVRDTAPSESRRLRSDSSVAKGSSTPLPRPKVNGHIKRSPVGKHTAAAPLLVPDQQGTPLPVEKEDEPARIDNGPSELPRLPKQTAKHTEAGSAVVTETSCPVVGCHWHAALSRRSVALLNHALEDHHRDDTPLELAFHIANGQCRVCLRVLWSFQHYRHHVERHRLTPRHPCLHQGCGARFRTGMEMRRHSRKHRPLQAGCCVPGCSELFICLWALNLHEREHYAGNDAKLAKARGAENPGPRKAERMRQLSRPAHAASTPVRGKGSLKLREQTMDTPSVGDAQVDPHSEVKSGDLGKGSSTLRRSQDSKRVEGVQVPAACPAGSRSAVSHKLRKTPLRQKAEPTNSTSQPSLVTTSRRMRRRLENRQAKLNVIGNKTKNPHLLSTRQRKCGRFVAEEQSSYHKLIVVSTSHEQSAPFASAAQEQSAPFDSPDQEQSALLDSTAQEQSTPNMVSTVQEQSDLLDSTAQEQSAPNMVSTVQEQSVLLDSTAQEQSAPNMVSTVQEQSSPTVISTAQKQSAPTLASTVQEQGGSLDSTAQEQSALLDSTAQEQSAPLDSTVQEQSAPLDSSAQEQSAHVMDSTVKEQSATFFASTAQEPSGSLDSTAQEQSALLDSTAQEQSAPTVDSTVQEQSAPLDSTAQEQSAPLDFTAQEQSAPLDFTAQEQSAPLDFTAQEQSAPLDFTAQEQSAPLDFTAQEQSAPLDFTAQEQSAPLDFTAQEQSAPLDFKAQEQSAPLDFTAQEQSAPLDFTAQEQSAPLDFTAQEQSAPLDFTAQEQSAPLDSTAQEQSAPSVDSTVQEQSAPLDSTAQEQSAPLDSTAQEQSAPFFDSTAQEQSAPFFDSTAQEQSAPFFDSTAQEQSAPLDSTAQEQSAPFFDSTAQEQSAPFFDSTAQEQSAPLDSTAQERSAPFFDSTAQQQSAPLDSTAQEQSAPLDSTAQEQSAPLDSTAQEQSAPFFDSTAQEQSAPLNSAAQEQVSKKHKQISAAPSNSDGHMGKKGRVAHLKRSPKTTKTASTGHTSKSKVKTPSKMKVSKATKDPSVAKATKGPSVAKATKGPSVAKATKGPSVAKATKDPLVAKATKDPSVAKATKDPSVAKATKGPSVAKATKGPSVAKATKGPSVAKATEDPSAAKPTEGPSVAMTTEVTAVVKATEVTASTKTTEIPQEAVGGVRQRVASDRVGYTVLVNGAAAGKRKAADEAAAMPSYRRTYFRAPPTTYLDERFTNMPKRRKHMSMFRSAPPKSLAPDLRPATRCPSCFVSFSHQEELQAHLGDQKCSSMFGFDSDEDNS